MAGRDITESNGEYDVSVDIGIVSSGSLWSNTDVAYDVAIGGIPFIYAINDARPYIRQTAPFRKDQFDNASEPGEQSLAGWWVRSQSSFHSGTGINFYDPLTNDENGRYRFADCKGVNVWTKGKVTLLNSLIENHVTTGQLMTNTRPNQTLQSIKWNDIDGVLLLDEYDVDKVYNEMIFSITNKSLTSNVATLTTSVAHTYTLGTVVEISDVDATFNGSYIVTAVTSTTFSYAKSSANVPSTPVTPNGKALSTITHFVDYNSGADTQVFAICNDGASAYWITNEVTVGVNKLAVYKKPLTANSSIPGTLMFRESGVIAANATMAFVKERIVACINNKIYEFPTSATALPTPVYTQPTDSYVYTSIAESGPAIYCSGFNGSHSSIIKFTLSSNGAMPVLAFAITSAEMPEGEKIYKMYHYLRYLAIGTSKGIRIATINDADGGINYGPLVVETSQPCYDFAARDRFIWCATGVDGEPGLIRLDLGNELEELRFAYANDVYYPGVTGHQTTACAFLNGTNQITFSTAALPGSNGHMYRENASIKIASGYLTTGKIRYGTLEPKNFKRLLARGDFDKGALTLETVTKDGLIYDHITYESGVTAVEVGTLQPETPQEYISYRFLFARDATTLTDGPIFEGWQAKSTIATPRQRVIQFPVYCFDVETDRFNSEVGYEGRADARLRALEAVEENGDVVVWQDITTGESRQCVIEQVTYTRMTPPDKRFDGQGGVIEIRIRTV